MSKLGDSLSDFKAVMNGRRLMTRLKHQTKIRIPLTWSSVIPDRCTQCPPNCSIVCLGHLILKP